MLAERIQGSVKSVIIFKAILLPGKILNANPVSLNGWSQSVNNCDQTCLVKLMNQRFRPPQRYR